jgi:hypothetical protein
MSNNYTKPSKKTKNIIALKNNEFTKQTKQQILLILSENNCKIPPEGNQGIDCSVNYITDLSNNDKVISLLTESFKKMIISITPYL